MKISSALWSIQCDQMYWWVLYMNCYKSPGNNYEGDKYGNSRILLRGIKTGNHNEKLKQMVLKILGRILE